MKEYTMKEAAKILGVSYQTMARYVREGRFNYRVVKKPGAKGPGNPNLVHVFAKDVQKFRRAEATGLTREARK